MESETPVHVTVVRGILPFRGNNKPGSPSVLVVSLLRMMGRRESGGGGHRVTFSSIIESSTLRSHDQVEVTSANKQNKPLQRIESVTRQRDPTPRDKDKSGPYTSTRRPTPVTKGLLTTQ